MGIPEQLRAQDAALEYLNKKITKDDLVAILLYTSTIQVMTDFTDDRDVLHGNHPGSAYRRNERAGRAGRYRRRQRRGYRRGFCRR